MTNQIDFTQYFAMSDLPEVQWDTFEVWRCFRPYPELDRVLAQYPEGVQIRRKRRGILEFRAGPLLGPGLQYSNLNGSWHVEQRVEQTPEQRARAQSRAQKILEEIKGK